MDKVYVKFPKAGLGNLMLIWAKAKLFATLNELEIVVAPWWGLRPGAWLRNEKKKRLYAGYFRESSIADRLKIKAFAINAAIVKNPAIKKIAARQQTGSKLYLFDKVSNGDDIFFDIREHRDFIKAEIYRLLAPAMQQQLNALPIPVVAVHIRRGDFVIGNQVTALSFFVDCINSIRKAANEILPVTVFTDAKADEIRDVLQLPQVTVAENKPDILDILLMSRARLMVLSKSSTFSYWGAFLSDAIVLRPHDDWQQQIRSNSINATVAEIGWKENDPACTQQLIESFAKQQALLQHTASA